MLTFIIIVSIGVIGTGSLCMWLNETKGLNEFISFCISIVTCIVFFFGSIIIFGTIIQHCKTYHKVDIQYIYALNDGSSVEGSFFLGSGTVDGKLVYNYAVKKGKGFTLDQINADGVEIRYINDNTKPRIENVSKLYKNIWAEIFFDAPGTDTYIYVPKGTIKQNYKIDLQ